MGKKVLAVASVGGHWIELIRLKLALEKFDTVYVSTNRGCEKMVDGAKFYFVKDFSRWNTFMSLLTIWQLLKIIIKEKPDSIISTGAAPGLVSLILGKLFFCKTIWIDSIANVDEISLSGKIAAKFVTKAYVQWPELANGKFEFKGNVF